MTRLLQMGSRRLERPGGAHPPARATAAGAFRFMTPVGLRGGPYRLLGARGRGAVRWLAVAAIHALMAAPAAAQDIPGSAPPPEPLPGLHAYVAHAMAGWDAPGLALVLVRGDSVYAHGYGVTEAGGDEPIDAHTLFGIGSLTKAFTATLLAMLVEEARVAWDDPVIRHLPEFAVRDPYLTEHLTVRDALSHRTGIAGDDLMWAAGGAEPGELIDRLRFQEAASGLRTGYGYNNLMYLVAGELAARLAGTSWSALVRERIFEPLGMERSTARAQELRRRSNVALPHDEIGPGQVLGTVPRAGVAPDARDRTERIEWFDTDAAPAGAIASSAADFGQWLRLQLGGGEVDGKRLIGSDALLETRRPQILTPGSGANQSERSETNLTAYGMGWGMRDYRGALMLSHLGSSPGWSSAAALLPAEGAGVAVFTNVSQGIWLADAIVRWMLDRVLDAELEDWAGRALEGARQRREAAAAALAEAAAVRVPGRPPSLPIAQYAGSYRDSLYPVARLGLRNDRLHLVLGPNLRGDLDHWQDDTFRVTWDRQDFGANLVTFEVGDGDRPRWLQARILGRQAVWRLGQDSVDLVTPSAGTRGLERALAIEREVRGMTGGRVLWPGFDPLTIPLAVHTGGATYLFRHPSPPEGFSKLTGVGPPTSVFDGRYPGVVANSTAEIGGTLTATILADGDLGVGAETDLAAVAVHEAFHAYQRTRHPSWSANEGDLFLYPIEDVSLLLLRRLESAALSRALEAPGPGGAACWARVALVYRVDRFRGMDPAFSNYERRTELYEGLATYIQLLASGETAVELPPGGFPAPDVRGRAYTAGAALALLLDRLRPGWQASLEADDQQFLDRMLEPGLRVDGTEGSDECAFEAPEVEEVKRRAERDAAAVIQARVARREQFEVRAGWRLVVVAADGGPLWPQGFDPLNIERVEGGIVHTRFLRVGNESGELQAIDEAEVDLETLTEGVGPHPLFNGIRRVIVAGLSEPEIHDEAGQVTVRAPGLLARFQGARVEVEGREARIHLARPG